MVKIQLIIFLYLFIFWIYGCSDSVVWYIFCHFIFLIYKFYPKYFMLMFLFFWSLTLLSFLQRQTRLQKGREQPSLLNNWRHWKTLTIIPPSRPATSESNCRQKQAWICGWFRYYYPVFIKPDFRTELWEQVRMLVIEFTVRWGRMKSAWKSAWFKCTVVNNAKRGPPHIVCCLGASEWLLGVGSYILFYLQGQK